MRALLQDVQSNKLPVDQITCMVDDYHKNPPFACRRTDFADDGSCCPPAISLHLQDIQQTVFSLLL